jgi:hypothetical protein
MTKQVCAIVGALCLLPAVVTAQSPTERLTIEVSLVAARTEAFNRTMSAMIAEGLVVGHADATSGIIVTVPKLSGGLLSIATIYRANILSIDDTASKVILSGGYTSKDAERLAGLLANPSGQAVLQDEKPLTSNMKRTFGDAWKVLERVGARLNMPLSGQ